jgi:hypothetical protein
MVKLGPNDTETFISMLNLAKFYPNFGRHAEALRLHEESVALSKAKLPPDQPRGEWFSNSASGFSP